MSTNDTRQARNEPRTTGSRSGFLPRPKGIGPVAMLLVAGLGALLFASIPYPHAGQPGLPAPFGEHPPGRPASRTRLKLLLVLLLPAGLRRRRRPARPPLPP